MRSSVIASLSVIAGAALMSCVAACTPDAPAPVDLPDPIASECADGYAMAEDMSCVPLTFWDDAPVGVEFPDVTLTACPTEDSDTCYWDGARMGNGTGRSFVRLSGVTYYAE